MSQAEFAKIVNVVLVLWCVLGIVLAVVPGVVLRGLTLGRIPFSRRTAFIFRILGVINAIGALRFLYSGKW